ncbi:MAG: PEP-CTERM sorting domain-containing protein [Pirellulaceae bacterium]|nr:PEP-CTERM sorting domain-containing protein [Planctomycetales bacterium]
MTISPKSFAVALCAVLCASSAAWAGTIDLNATYNGGNAFNGNTVMFTNVVETNGAPADPAQNFYQSPAVLGDALTVNPVDFRVEILPGPGVNAVDSQLEMVIMAKPGYTIKNISMDEGGDFEVRGNANVKAEVNWFFEVLELNGAAPPVPMTGNGTSSTAHGTPPNQSGIWNLGTSVGIPAGATKVRFEFDNRLTGQAVNDLSLAFIAKKQIGGIKVETMVPEPASVAMILFGLIPVISRLRRR